MPTIKRDSPGAFQSLALKLKGLEKVQGKVGWFQTAKYENGTPVAYVAAIQELGSAAQSIPPRPFMRPTAQKEKESWSQIAAGAASEVLAGNSTPEQAMGILTLKAESDVLKAIVDITTPPLSPITIELRAMKQRTPGLVITGATVGIAAARVRAPGYQTPSVSTKPLNDTGHMIATLTHIVEKA